MLPPAFTPKLFTTLRGYTLRQFGSDLTAGTIVGIVALPLAIAFAIASGVSPEKGLVAAIIGGFLISAMGGSRVQIGGPTGAFIVIVYSIVHEFGIAGLTVATFMAGIMLIIMGLARLGSVIKFIPYPLIVGFTSGIAVIILFSQVKDFLGLEMGALPADFLGKWQAFYHHIGTINLYAAAIALSTLLIGLYFQRITHRIPGSLVAIVLATVAVQTFHLPVETIGSRFGEISSSLPMPEWHSIDFDTFRKLIGPGFTIAVLCGIESLLSAVVADGMIGGNHRSNAELVAQGSANIFSSLFGGIPATGAIARTATNVKNGGRTPIAGIVHALVLLLILLFFGKWAAYIPMACLAGILVLVAYHMSEYKSFLALLRGPRSDIAVLLTTFLLTVFIDLTVAIQIGMVLAAFLFMRRMIKISNVEVVTTAATNDADEDDDPRAIINFDVPKGVEVFEIKGPFFFGAAYKFRDSMRIIERTPKVLIVRMRHVPVIDATGLNALEEVFRRTRAMKTHFLISGIQHEVLLELKRSSLLAQIGRENVVADIETALMRARQLIG